jgi:hypothetical protein
MRRKQFWIQTHLTNQRFSSIEIVKLSVSNKIPIKTILGLGDVAFSIDSSIPQHFSKSPKTFKQTDFSLVIHTQINHLNNSNYQCHSSNT